MIASKQQTYPRAKACTIHELPVELAQRISTFLPPIMTDGSEELQELLQVYPLEYLSVGMQVRDKDSEHCIQLLSESAKVKEVMLCSWSGNCLESEIAGLLGMDLECFCLELNLEIEHVSKVSLRCAVILKNKRHFFDLQFYDEGQKGDIICSCLSTLAREDKALVWLEIFGSKRHMLCSKLAYRLRTPGYTHLQHLKIMDCRFEDEGAKLLRTALQINNHLLTLTVFSGEVTDYGLYALGEGVLGSKSLVGFSGCFPFASPYGYYCLANFVASSQTLQSLSILNGDLGDEGGIALTNLIQVNCTLLFLTLQLCKIETVARRNIVDAVEKSESLEGLRVVKSGFTKAQLARLEKVKRIRMFNDEPFSTSQFDHWFSWHLMLRSRDPRALRFACRSYNRFFSPDLDHEDSDIY